MRTFEPKIFFKFLLIFLFSANLLAWLVVYDLARPRFLEVVFFNVGQGDSVFIETPQRHQILIDGGPSSVVLEKLAKEMPFWDRTIDLMILTHPSFDHLNGLLMVLERYQINKILWTGIEVETSAHQQWIKLIPKENAVLLIAQAGQRIKMGESIYLDILHPVENLKGKKFKGARAINNTSIVARLVYHQNSFLFTADTEKEAERKLLDKETYLDSDVLKVGHHGSKTSSTKEFLLAVTPEIAVISVGKDNQYGHPHQEVLDGLEAVGVKVSRTDREDDIKILSDGKRLIMTND